jgi:crotonobetainyl-CoA:carnitine CoA-transferase CaiB-like acyl-CoA transferase
MYDLLDGVRVLDVSLLAPSMLGMRLAELGADVVKVEQPPYGDRYRTLLAPFRGVEGAPGIFHLFANRGKRSLSLDLQKPVGKQVFLELVAKSDVVIVGIRPNAMDRWGLTYEAMRAVNPKIVYCLLSGLGSYGPYKDLGSHGAFFDSYAGITPVEFREEDGLPYIGQSMSVGTIAAALYAATGVLAALLKAGRTGQGSKLEVAQTDAAVLFQVNQAAPIVAGEHRAVGAPRGARDAVRYQNYETKDGKYIMFFPFEAKFWTHFCQVIERPDLLGDAQAGRPDAMNNDTGNEALRRELVAIFKTRTQGEWTSFFLEYDVPGGPIYDLQGALEDPHFLARDNVFEQEVPGVGLMRAIGTPIKVEGQDFDVRPAPRAGEHTDEVLREILGYDDGRVAALREQGVVS